PGDARASDMVGPSPLPAPDDPHFESQPFAESDHLAEYITVSYRDVVAQVMGHHGLHGAAQIGSHERPLPRGAFPPGVTHVRRQLYHLALADVHPQLILLDVGPRPGDLTRQAFSRKSAAGNWEIPGRLAVAMHAF